MIERRLKIELGGHNAAFLWGPRKTGKTTLLRRQFPSAKFYDLLKTDIRLNFLLNPSLLREAVLAGGYDLVIVDEIQKAPALLEEIHWCLENTATKFIMCGSSARKVRRGAANLLGGRAWRFELFPLVTCEIKSPDLLRMLNHGLLPKHYIEDHPERSLRSYLLDYIGEEINAEALTRNIPAFSRFLEAVALTHGRLLNYANIARGCGVSAKTVREYYQILDDTLLGHALPPWRKSRKRRLIETPKYYLFDVGLMRALSDMRLIQAGTEEFGRFFEHFMIEEVRAYLSYSEKHLPLSYWRTSTGLEVDLIAGDLDLAVEFKAAKNVREADLRGVMALVDDQKVKRALAVSLDDEARKLSGGMEVLPWQVFCERLWADELL